MNLEGDLIINLDDFSTPFCHPDEYDEDIYLSNTKTSFDCSESQDMSSSTQTIQYTSLKDSTASQQKENDCMEDYNDLSEANSSSIENSFQQNISRLNISNHQRSLSGSGSSPVSPIRDKLVDDVVQVSKNFLPVIKGGTVDKLIERLTYESSSEWDSDYVDAFLLTHKSFMSSNDLIIRLCQRYFSSGEEVNKALTSYELEVSKNKEKIVKLRVVNILKKWLIEYSHDFRCDGNLISLVKENVKNFMPDHIQIIERAIEKLHELKRNTSKSLMFGSESPESIIPKGNNFEVFDNTEIARQLCLYIQNMYRKISPNEAMNQSWRNRDTEKAPNIVNMINYFDRLSRWTASKVLLKDSIKERCEVISKFINICSKLREYHNFDSLQAIISGLNNASVYRLKQTWEKMRKKKVYQVLLDCEELLDPSSNFSLYRKTLSTIDQPIIPYMGVYLSDLTLIQDGNPII